MFILDGVLIIVASAMDDDGQYYGNINDNTQNVVVLLSHLWEHGTRRQNNSGMC